MSQKPSKRARDNAPAKMAEVLEYASTCILPTTFIDLPLVAKREHNHDSTIYTFGLPEGKSLSLPVCACVLLKAPGRGRGPNGKDDFDGSDAIRPYTPMSDNAMLGQFELCVKRYDGGAVSQWLYGLELGAKVGFKHISFNIKAPYPFDGKKSITLLCAGTGLAPMYQVCPSAHRRDRLHTIPTPSPRRREARHHASSPRPARAAPVAGVVEAAGHAGRRAAGGAAVRQQERRRHTAQGGAQRLVQASGRQP